MEDKMKKYIADGGVACPFCGCGDIEGDQVEIDVNVALQKVSCALCEEEWIDYYKLDCVAVEDKETGDLIVYNKDGKE